MKKTIAKSRAFINKTFIGGILVLMPIGVTVMIGRWFFLWVTDLIQPLTNLLIKSNDLPEVLGDFLVVSIIVLLCFIVGYIISTGAGRFIHSKFDHYLVRLAPGYKIIKEIISQFFGDEKNSPFANGQVGLAQLYGTDVPTYATVLITSKHPNGDFTVFVPTGPNPTSGQILHLKPEQVTIRDDIPVESMMRTIIACGAGSGHIFYKQEEEDLTGKSSKE